MPCRHNGTMVFMVKSCTAKIDQPYIRPFHTPDISFLQKDGKNIKTPYKNHTNPGFSHYGRYNTTVTQTAIHS